MLDSNLKKRITQAGSGLSDVVLIKRSAYFGLSVRESITLQLMSNVSPLLACDHDVVKQNISSIFVPLGFQLLIKRKV